MNITKQSEEITYLQKTTLHTIKINGKEVCIWSYVKNDSEHSDYENNTDINEDDKAKLTDIELEAIGEYMTEVLETEVGETFNSENN